MTESTETEVVLVTGGTGFLGQNLIKHLQEHDDTIQEIRVLGRRTYKNTLEHHTRVPIRSIIGDLRNLQDVQRAVSGCTTVFHAASVIQVGTCVDKDFIYGVNVKGTENVIQACLDQNVRNLVYTGSVDTFKILKEEFGVCEDTMTYRDPLDLAFPEYGGSKMKAELLVINAHGKKSSTGAKSLRTVVLRPTAIYGEGNYQHGPAEVLKNTKKRGGVLLPVSGIKEVLWQLTYVGNVAWAHIITWRALKKDFSVGGQGYFITDDTPVTNYLDFNKRFLDARGFRISERTLPRSCVMLIAYFTVFFCWLLKPFKQIHTYFTPRTIRYVSYSTTYNGDKLRKVSGYKPLYSAEQAFDRSVRFYRDISL